MELTVIFDIDRQRLTPPDFKPFLRRYAPEHWPASPAALRQMRGSLMLSFHGYDDDPRELYCIPEVRRFVQAWHEAWPYGLYFLSAEPWFSTLPVLTACRLESLAVLRQEDGAVCQIQCDPGQVQALLNADLPAFKRVADRARLLPRHRREQLTAVYGLFGLVPNESALKTAGALAAA